MQSDEISMFKIFMNFIEFLTKFQMSFFENLIKLFKLRYISFIVWNKHKVLDRERIDAQRGHVKNHNVIHIWQAELLTFIPI